MPSGWHQQVVRGEAVLRADRQGRRLTHHGPIRRTGALETLVVHVLVEVEHHRDAVVAQGLVGLEDLVEVIVVVDAGLGFERFPDDAQANRVEAMALKEPGIVLAEADRLCRIGRRAC